MGRLLTSAAAMVALGISAATHAADVGRVLLAAGDTVAIRANQPVRLAYGAMIQDKDVLRTGAASNLQVRFIDESIVSMKESSELRIDDFRYSGKEDGSERGFMSLLKGGLRTITGLIGRGNNANYRLNTVTATIGIRGTDYAATLCQGDCRNNDGSLAKDGLYGRTLGQSHGTNRIDVSNERDQKTFGINENFYVADAKSVVEPLLVAPDFLSNKLEGRKQGGSKGESGGSGSEQATTGGVAAESRPSTTPEPLPQLSFTAPQDLGPQGTPVVLAPANGWVVVYTSPSFADLIFDDNDPAVFNSSNQLLSYSTSSNGSGSLNGGTIVDAGSYTYAYGATLSWGRWTGNTQIVTSTNATLTGAPLLFGTASGLTQNTNSVQPAGGVVTYNYVGGPQPVDGGGNVGTITSNSLALNFTNQNATYAMGVNFAGIGANFTVGGVGIRNFNNSGGEFSGSLSGSCIGVGCASPSVTTGGFEVGTDGPNGYELAVVGGGFYGTLAGPVVFLNAYQSSSFTPGPSGVFNQAGSLAYADTSIVINTANFDPNLNVFSGTDLIAYGNGSTFPSGMLNSGTVADTGSVALIDGSTMRWGRWTGSSVQVISSPSNFSLNPPTGMPYVMGDANTVVPTSGSFTYTYAGGPSPVNTSGVVGTFNSGAFNVSFGSTSGSISVAPANPLSLTVGGVGYSLTSCTSGCTFPNSSPYAGNMVLTGTCSTCGTSAASSSGTGIFVGPQGTGLALAGNITSAEPTISFAAGFKR